MDDNSANALRLTHHFAGPPALVWTVWTRPELIRSWFGSSHGFRAHDIAVDLRPGGTWSLRNVNGPVTEHVSGTYHEVDPTRRLVYSYHFEGTDFFSVISIDLTAEASCTRLHFLQTGFPNDQARIEHAKGWPHALKVMSDALLAMHGVGTLWPKLPDKTHLDGVARDLEAARQRLAEETTQ
ncbi:MAG: SRPBCC domain-containing protein [Tabrizicola sp.]